MKLTKEIIRLFKYHGFMTVTAPDEDILKRYQTVEDLTNAGFVNDPEALRMAKMVFVEDGTPAVGPTKDEDVVEAPVETITTITEDPIEDPEPKPENENPITEEPAADPESEKVEEKIETETETTPTEELEKEVESVETETTPTEEPVAEPEPEKVEEEVETETETTTSEPEPEAPAPKPKKTTTKKSTKKES